MRKLHNLKKQYFLLILPIFIIFPMLMSTSSATTYYNIKEKDVPKTDIGGHITRTGGGFGNSEDDYAKIQYKIEGAPYTGGLRACRIYAIKFPWWAILAFADWLIDIKFEITIKTHYISKTYDYTVWEAGDPSGNANDVYGELNIGIQDWVTISPTHPYVALEIAMKIHYWAAYIFGYMEFVNDQIKTTIEFW